MGKDVTTTYDCRQFSDTSRQFPTFLRHVCLFVHVIEFAIKRHNRQFPTSYNEINTTKFWPSLLASLLTFTESFHDCSLKGRKQVNTDQFGGLSWDWVGSQIMFMCFLGAIPYGGEKTAR